MISIVDSFRINNEHEIINGRLINSIANQNQEVTIYLHKSQYECLKRLNQIDFKHNYKKIINVRNKSKINTLVQYFVSMIQDVNIYLKNEKIIYLTLNPFSLLIISMLNIIGKKELTYVCHGELEILGSGGEKNFSKYMRIIAKIFKFVFNKTNNKNITYIILGESIKRNIIDISPKYNSYNFKVIDHPYVFKKYTIKKMYDINKETLILGTLGVNTYEKGSEKIFVFAEMIRNKIQSNKIILCTTGPIKIKIPDESKELVALHNNSSVMLPRKDYDQLISNLDVVLFFYDLDSYQFTASGAFFDALNYRKPIIAIKNSYFKYYFERFGEMGVLCNDLEEMKNVIDNVDAFLNSYYYYVDNIEKAICELEKEIKIL